MKNTSKTVELLYSVKDENGYLVDKKQKFSTFIDAVKFARNMKKNGVSFKPVIR